MDAREIRVVTEGHPTRPGLDTAVARALLLQGNEGAAAETFRLHVPDRIVAFGKRDVITPGYAEAVAASRSGGFAPVERLAGGRAAVFHEHTLAFSWMIPDPDPAAGIRSRFTSLAELMVRAFGRLGIETAVGEVAGEYCPGEYSVHLVDPLRGNRKVMGVGQRLARRAAHIGGVVVVDHADLVNGILVPVYRHLGLNWDPAATGALAEAAPGTTTSMVARAIREELARLAVLVDARLDPTTIQLAEELLPEHLPRIAA